MNKIKCIVIDDERLARKELISLLSVYNQIEIIGEAQNGKEAITMIAEYAPDLIFLDIQMPLMNGFQVLEALDTVPRVVFTTAYDQYALKAFEVSALDFLMKPIRPERLKLCLDKLKEEFRQHIPPKDSKTLEADNQVFLKDGDNCHFVKIHQITYIESQGNYARLYFNGQSAMIKRSLNQLEARLTPKLFFRCNRHQVINLQYIDDISPMFKGSLRITMSDGQKIDVSERKSVLFKERMSL